MLHKLRIVDIIREGVNNSIQVDLMAVTGKLDAVRETACKIADEFRRGSSRSSYPASDLVDLAGAEALMGGNPHKLLIEPHCHVVRAGLGG